MRANEFITELFGAGDTGLELEWNDRTASNGQTITTAVGHDKRGREFEMTFLEWDADSEGVTEVDFSVDQEWEDTGLGLGKTIFATAVLALKQYVSGRHPDYIIFSGEESRFDLYTNMIARLAPQLGYQSIENSDDAIQRLYYGDKIPDGKFVLQKKGITEDPVDLNALRNAADSSKISINKSTSSAPGDINDPKHKELLNSLVEIYGDEKARIIGQKKLNLAWKMRNPDVTESLDQPYAIHWEQSEHGDWDAQARLPDGTPLTIQFDHTTPYEVEVSFERSGSLEITGRGDSQRVFATVLAAIKDYIQRIEQPANISFSATKEVDPNQKTISRSKLYDRLVNRYAASLGYNAQTFDHKNRVSFELTPFQNPFTEQVIAKNQDVTGSTQ